MARNKLLPLGCVSVALACGAGAGDDGVRGGGSGNGQVPRAGNTSTAGSTFAGSSSSFAGGGARPVIDVTLGGQNAGNGGAPICNELGIETKPVTPTVIILVDNSGSMYEPRAQLWDRLYTVLMDPTVGVLPGLQSKIRFGFASYKGVKQVASETDETCAVIDRVAPALDNLATIDTTYKAVGSVWKPGDNWQTPTGHAVRRVTAELAAYQPDPPGPKYILLVTDGNPDTCQVQNPQCGQDLSVKAVQDAHALGIGTFAIGIGDIVTTNSGCEPVRHRCGVNHLQDIANAGLGLPVQAPPPEFVNEQCVVLAGGAKASYAPAGTAPGTAPYFTATDQPQLKSAITGLLNNVLSCTVEMNAIVDGDPSKGFVTLGGQRVPFGDANGWKLEDNKYSVTLQGTACDTFKSGSTLHIGFPCPPPGEPPIVRPR